MSRQVSLIKGNRKSDMTEFYGLKFTSDSHAGLFITPAQFRSVLALAEEAKLLLRKMPRTSATTIGEK